MMEMSDIHGLKQLDEKRVLKVYYIQLDRAKGTRHIQGSILEIEPQG